MTISGRLTAGLCVTNFDDLPYDDEAYVLDAIAENEDFYEEDEEEDEDEN